MNTRVGQGDNARILKSVPLSIVLSKNVPSKNLVHEPCQLVPPKPGDDF